MEKNSELQDEEASGERVSRREISGEEPQREEQLHGKESGRESLEEEPGCEEVSGGEEALREDTTCEGASEEEVLEEDTACEEASGEESQDRMNLEDWLEELDEIEGKHRKNFWKGYLSGAVTVVVLAVLFLAGVQTGRLLSLRRHAKQKETEAGSSARVLTATETLVKLDEIRGLIENHYLGDIDQEELAAYLFKGVAAGLDDLYAAYFTEEELQSLLESSRGSYNGIGAVLRYDKDTQTISVDELYEGYPAWQAGLAVGDILQSVGGEDVVGKSLDETVSLIKRNDETFDMTVYRPDTEEELTFSITCGYVEVTAVTYEMKTDSIGYIRIREFTEKAVPQFIEAAKALKEQGMQKLIVDLRDNPGGLLDSVCGILDEVLPESLMVYTEDRNGERVEYTADRKRTLDCEIAVLVNGNSASASEIFTGAIQDYGIGPVIGTQTYGKGIVQQTYTLSDGSAFKMTVEKYYTPGGQDIQGNGITPDFIVEEESGDTQAEKDTELDGNTQAEEDTELDGNTQAEEDAQPDKDAQPEEEMQAAGDAVLAKALEVLQRQAWKANPGQPVSE